MRISSSACSRWAVQPAAGSRATKTAKHAYKLEGLTKVIEGDWKQAEKLVIKSAKHSDAPLLNYLAAAEAAQGQGDASQRDEYLKLAAEVDGQSLAVALTRAKLQYRQQQFEQAVATLQDIKRDHGRNLYC